MPFIAGMARSYDPRLLFFVSPPGGDGNLSQLHRVAGVPLSRNPVRGAPATNPPFRNDVPFGACLPFTSGKSRDPHHLMFPPAEKAVQIKVPVSRSQKTSVASIAITSGIIIFVKEKQVRRAKGAHRFSRKYCI
jgi:hypothetical protein